MNQMVRCPFLMVASWSGRRGSPTVNWPDTRTDVFPAPAGCLRGKPVL